jgi:hypothetical protein
MEGHLGDSRLLSFIVYTGALLVAIGAVLGRSGAYFV